MFDSIKDGYFVNINIVSLVIDVKMLNVDIKVNVLVKGFELLNMIFVVKLLCGRGKGIVVMFFGRLYGEIGFNFSGYI